MDVKIQDGRRLRMRRIKEKNRCAVVAFFNQNKEATISDCCRATGLSFPTVKKHVNAIQVEAK